MPAHHRPPAAAPIERQSPRLVRLIDDLLDVARINHGVIALKRERVDPVRLEQVIANLLDSCVECPIV